MVTNAGYKAPDAGRRLRNLELPIPRREDRAPRREPADAGPRRGLAGSPARRTAATIVLLFGLLLVSVSCRKRDIRTAMIHVPEMKNDACVEIVVKALGNRPGVLRDSIEVDRAGRMVTVPYNSIELSLKNLEFAVAQAGFQANVVPPDANALAKLPPECR